MLFKLAADLVVLIHLGFILFVLFGGFLALRWPRIVRLHAPALAWGVLVELLGWYCPLTPLEQTLRNAAGEGGYHGGFIEHYIVPLIYPIGLTRETQFVFAGIVLGVNMIAYILYYRHKRQKKC